jgi:DNA-binding transcriptional LysR family regulator
VVVGAKHPWVNRTKISPKDLPTTAWVLRERGSGTRSIFEAALRQYGIKLSDLRVALELPSNEAVRTAVEAGGCATAISDLVVAQSLAAKALHRVRFDLPRRSFYILRHKERHPSRVEHALLNSLHI